VGAYLSLFYIKIIVLRQERRSVMTRLCRSLVSQDVKVSMVEHGEIEEEEEEPLPRIPSRIPSKKPLRPPVDNEWGCSRRGGERKYKVCDATEAINGGMLTTLLATDQQQLHNIIRIVGPIPNHYHYTQNHSSHQPCIQTIPHTGYPNLQQPLLYRLMQS